MLSFKSLIRYIWFSNIFSHSASSFFIHFFKLIILFLKKDIICIWHISSRGTMIQYLHILWNDHHTKSSYHPSQHSYNFFPMMRHFQTYSQQKLSDILGSINNDSHHAVHYIPWLILQLEVCTFRIPFPNSHILHL